MDYIWREASTIKMVIIILVTCMSTVRCQGDGGCSYIETSDPFHVLLVNNRCYHMVQDTITWNQAATACRARNGSLAVIRNSETNSRLLQRAQNLDSNDRAEVSFYWIGGRIQARGDAITWELDVNGAAVGNPFTAYAEDQPSGFGERGCVLMDPSVMGWATEYCELDFELVGYVCEYEPNGSMSNMRTRMSKVLLTFLLTVVLGHAV